MDHSWSRERQTGNQKSDSVLPQFNLRKSIEMIGRMFKRTDKEEENVDEDEVFE